MSKIPFWPEYKDSIKTEHWMSKEVFNEAWRDRGEQLLQMFFEREYNLEMDYAVAEYGCGPYAPIHTLCSTRKNMTVEKFDLQLWDKHTKSINLNDPNLELPRVNIAVFSGVLEYVDDIEAVLAKAINSSDYVLFSYAFLPERFRILKFVSDKYYLRHINFRAARNGWRNHLSNEQLLDIISKYGVLSSVNIWNNRQSLFLIKNRYLDKKQ